MRPRKTALGTVQPVTDVNGEPFVAVLSKASLGISPAKAREAASALLDAAEAAEAAARPARVTVQDGLWGPEAAA
jgi:hypothetical protein